MLNKQQGSPAAAADGTAWEAVDGSGEREWLAAAGAFRAAAGISTSTALLAFGPDRRIVRDALGVLVSLLCGEGGLDCCSSVLPSMCHLIEPGQSAALDRRPSHLPGPMPRLATGQDGLHSWQTMSWS